MKKYIANLLTCGRITFSFPLLFIPLSSAWFYILYIFCGITDMIDGTIARKMGAVSKFGEIFDTVADFVFMAVCVVKLLHIINIPAWLWTWIAIIAIIKVINIATELIRRRKLLALHTVLNKTTGFLLFLLPLALQYIVPTYSFAVVCTVATTAAIQECYHTMKIDV